MLLDAKLSFSGFFSFFFEKKNNIAIICGRKRQTKADALHSLGENAEGDREVLNFTNVGAGRGTLIRLLKT